MKKKEHGERGIPFDGEFYLWDLQYYHRKYVKETLSLDDTLVKQYFPVSVVVQAILSIYQNFLGVRFEALKEASTWHPGQ
jgi:Zn-dependent oligopeptidase